MGASNRGRSDPVTELRLTTLEKWREEMQESLSSIAESLKALTRVEEKQSQAEDLTKKIFGRIEAIEQGLLGDVENPGLISRVVALEGAQGRYNFFVGAVAISLIGIATTWVVIRITGFVPP